MESNTELPHSRCNYITDDKLILVGASPMKSTIGDILRSGVTCFVDLREQPNQGYDYFTDVLINYTATTLQYIQFPIKPGRAPAKGSKFDTLIASILECYTNREKIYVHCSGGHGRAGLVSAILIGKINGVKGPEAIHMVERFRDQRLDTSRNFIPTPEMNTQIQFVMKMLGPSENNVPAPTRNDKAWIRRLKTEKN